jgi:hypothetical protein
MMKCRIGFAALFTMIFSTMAYAADPPKVRVWLDKELSWEATLIGRTHAGDQIRFLRKGKEGEVRLAITDILRVDYEIEISRAEVMDLYLREEYDKLKELLDASLAPAKNYLDLPGNLWRLHLVYMKTLYWSGDHVRLEQYASRLLQGPPTRRARDEATLFKVLALTGLGMHEESRALLSEHEISPGTITDPPLYHLAQAKVAIANGDRNEALEELATIVSFHAKAFEWMPAALHDSATQYMERGQPDVAIQIAKEIQVAYPGSTWRKKAAALQSKFEKEREGEENLFQHMAK